MGISSKYNLLINPRQCAVEGITETVFVLQTSIALVTGSMIVMVSEIIRKRNSQGPH